MTRSELAEHRCWGDVETKLDETCADLLASCFLLSQHLLKTVDDGLVLCYQVGWKTLMEFNTRGSLCKCSSLRTSSVQFFLSLSLSQQCFTVLCFGDPNDQGIQGKVTRGFYWTLDTLWSVITPWTMLFFCGPSLFVLMQICSYLKGVSSKAINYSCLRQAGPFFCPPSPFRTKNVLIFSPPVSPLKQTGYAE